AAGRHTIDTYRVNSTRGFRIQVGIPRGPMKKLMVLLSLVLLGAAAFAMPLGTSSRAVIPSDIQQIISVDYRALHDSPTAQALKGVGIDSDRDVDQLTFAAYRMGKQGVKVVGMAQGSFSSKTVLKRMKMKKIMPAKYRDSSLYSMGNGMIMTFLDENTLLFGDDSALKGALDARDGLIPTLDSNSQMADMMAAVDGSAVWSLLDQQGTQNMMRSAL